MKTKKPRNRDAQDITHIQLHRIDHDLEALIARVEKLEAAMKGSPLPVFDKAPDAKDIA